MSYKVVVHYPKNRPDRVRTVATILELNFHHHPKIKKNKASATVEFIQTINIDALQRLVHLGAIISYKIKRVRSSNEKYYDKYGKEGANE